MTTVGFIGVGAMGSPMVERIAGAGFALSAFVRRDEVAQRLRRAGIEVAPSVAALAGRSDVLVVCTFSDPQVREVAFGQGGTGGALSAMAPGSVLVNHVTGNPALALEMATRAPEGVGVVDAPVSGGPDQIRAGRLTVLAGADPDVLERARPVLSSYADPILHVGGVGDGQRVKLVNNLVFTAHIRIAVLAGELGRSLGVSEELVGRALVHCSGTSLPISMLAQGPASALASSARRFLAKDVAVLRTTAEELGLDLGPLGSLSAWVDGEPVEG